MRCFPGVKLKNIPIWKISGFESVRSSELLGLIKAQFNKVCMRLVNYGGVFFPLVVCNWPAAQKRVGLILELDEEVSHRNELSPCYHMGVYRKSNAMPPKVVPWTDEEV